MAAMDTDAVPQCNAKRDNHVGKCAARLTDEATDESDNSRLWGGTQKMPDPMSSGNFGSLNHLLNKFPIFARK